LRASRRGSGTASNRTGYTGPDGSTNTHSYDMLNRLTTLANSWAGSFGFSYDALSRRTQMRRPNGVNTNYSYDSLSRLLSVLHQAGASTIDGASYTVDASGNRTSKTDQMAGVTANYSYDALYELKQVTQAANTTENYTYDPVGNRLSSLTAATMSYNSSNELTATPSTTYTYDANGNTTSKTDSTGTTNYTWDFENRLTSYSTLLTGGLTGNLAVTYLGLYGLRYTVENETLNIHVWNRSDISSATHPPGPRRHELVE
jgi:YD repeat-containing protein